MSRGRQALWALVWFVGGCLGALAGGFGYESGIAWLEQGAVYVTGGCWGMASVFLLRAVVPERFRRWFFPSGDPDADTYGRHHRPD